ncbi:peptidase [Cronobacter turicensis]
MNLFERLLYRRLCNEQPADGGAPPAASAPEPGAEGGGDNPASTAQPTEPAPEPTEAPAGKPQPGAEGDKPGDKQQKQEGAPEKYEFTAAEGVELDKTALAEFEPVARDLGLSQEQAQKLVDVYPKLLAGMQQRQAEAWQQQTEEWAANVKADKEIGGDKLTANLGVAQRAVDQFGSPALKEYLDGTGLGNHPELVKFCVKVGKAMAEDGVVMPGTGGTRSAAEVLYGK